jgi:hypothetical protein
MALKKIFVDIVDWLRDIMRDPRAFFSYFIFGCVILTLMVIVSTFAMQCYYEHHELIKEYEKTIHDIYSFGGCGIVVLLLTLLFINLRFLFD